jgi:Bifunctional DNA primase/polymerase, N-terminal
MTKIALKKSTHLSTALLCAKHGLRVVPLHGLRDGRCTCGDKDCKQPGRHPRTPNGIKDATSKPAAIKKFWSRWPQAKIAIAIGAPDIIALTLKGNDGVSALKKHGTLAKTVELRDGKFRTHLLKASIDAIPDGTVRITQGVVVRGRGKFVILPSGLKVAVGRHFVSGRGIGETAIAAAPDWLLTLIGRRQKGSSAKAQATASWDGVTFNLRPVDVDFITDGGEPCDPQKVRRLAESYSVTGARTPPVVRLLDHTKTSPGKNAPEYAVLSDRHQIEALKSLGAKTIDCIVADADDEDAILWQGGELFHRREATVLDRAEIAVNCLRRIRAKAGQTPTLLRRRQPHDKGYSAAEKLLGVSRRDLRRLEKIAGICPAAKKVARRAKLDNILNALLEIADVPAGKQVAKVRKLKEEYAGGRRKPSAPAQSKKSAGSSAGAATKKKGVDTKEGPDDAEYAEAEPRDDVENDAEDAEAEGSSIDSSEDAEDDADDPKGGAESPPTAPEDDGLDIPLSFLRTDDDTKYQAFGARWARYCEADFQALPAAMQTKFASELLGKAVIATGKGEGPR